eukprot:6233503-Amphidinium_carterae.1
MANSLLQLRHRGNGNSRPQLSANSSLRHGLRTYPGAPLMIGTRQDCYPPRQCPSKHQRPPKCFLC